MLNTIINDNCKNIFPKIKEQYKNFTVITDPPYNISFKGYDKYEDNLSDEEYISLIKTFRDVPCAIMQYPEETMKYIAPALGVPNICLAWCYNSNLTRRFRLISIYNAVPNFEKVLQPFKNREDKRVLLLTKKGRKGTPIYEWFSDIQLVKNVSFEKTVHPCPIPTALMSRIIELITDEGSLVVDPFCGVGTTLIACKIMKRNYIGIDLSKKYCEIAKQRLSGEMSYKAVVSQEGREDKIIKNDDDIDLS